MIKKMISLLPTFFIEVWGSEGLVIKKAFSFVKARYTIDKEGIEVRGNWWEMDFEVIKDGQTISPVHKQVA